MRPTLALRRDWPWRNTEGSLIGQRGVSRRLVIGRDGLDKRRGGREAFLSLFCLRPERTRCCVLPTKLRPSFQPATSTAPSSSPLRTRHGLRLRARLHLLRPHPPRRRGRHHGGQDQCSYQSSRSQCGTFLARPLRKGLGQHGHWESHLQRRSWRWGPGCCGPCGWRGPGWRCCSCRGKERGREKRRVGRI